MARCHRNSRHVPVSNAARLFSLLLSLASFASGLALAASHPVQPVFAVAAFLAVLPFFARSPWLAVVAAPAYLPLLNFSPWTGWLIVDEFDLLVLCAACGGHFRLWRDGVGSGGARKCLALLLVAAVLVGRGLLDLSAEHIDWFSGYMTPLNSLRVGKTLIWVALLLPVIEEAAGKLQPARLTERFFWALLIGSGWVVLAVLWERSFFPGLLDLGTSYRTVGPFWEMHHGGGALDAYLALVAPVLAWAWQRTSSSAGRTLLGLYVLAFGYATLTTFSRGVVFAIGGALILYLLLWVWQARRHAPGRLRIRASSILMLVLIASEIVFLAGGDSFLTRRLHDTTRDFGGRLAHWSLGMRLLGSPAEWLFGIGLGKIPARMIHGDEALALSGSFEVVPRQDGSPVVRLSGPTRRVRGVYGGPLYALTQRFEPVAGISSRFSAHVRSIGAATLFVQTCASHLLYPARCSRRLAGLADGEERTLRIDLPATAYSAASSWRNVAHGVLLLSVTTPGATVEMWDVQLEAGGKNLLANGEMGDGKGRWFPQSFRYFLPWHIDSLYVELLLETGLTGLLAFLALVGGRVMTLMRGCVAGETFSPVLLSSLASLLALGLVVSMIDMPRVATLSGLVLVLATIPRPADNN